MDQDDRPPEPPPPVLDYGTPPPLDARSLHGPTVRFTAGVALPMLALLVFAAWHGEDMICCVAIGLLIELFLIGGSFQIGQRLCRWSRGRAQVERHWILTIAAGVVAAGVIGASLAIVDRVPRVLGGVLGLVGMFVVPIAAPWAVCRDQA